LIRSRRRERCQCDRASGAASIDGDAQRRRDGRALARLAERRGGACLPRRVRDHGLRRGGIDHDRARGQGPCDPFAQHPAAPVRQHEIQDHRVRRIARALLGVQGQHRFSHRSGTPAHEAIALEPEAQRLGGIVIVLDEEDS